MSSDTNFERLRIDQKPPETYRRFVSLAQRTSQIVSSEFRSINPNSNHIPPVAIFSDRVMDAVVSPTLAIPLAHQVTAAYQPVNDEVHASLSLAHSSDTQKTALILAEEFIHAQTTVDLNGSVRVAYNTFPAARQQSVLKPGAIYNLSRLKTDQLESTEAVVITGDQDTILLLERSTLLAVHLMLNRLLNRSYPLLALTREGEQPYLILKNRRLLVNVLESMYTDDPEKLPHRMLSYLQNPEPITWVSLNKDNSDDFIGMKL